MDHFPILVEHGPVIWRVLQVLSFVAVLVAIWMLRLRIATRNQLVTLRSLRANHGALRGVLRGGGATTVSVEPAASSSAQRDVAHWRAESLHLETADRTIELVGPVQVVGGSRYDARRGRLPRLEAPRREVVAEAIPWSTGSIYGALALHVADGDEVEVRGAPQPSAGPGETTPRDADISWSMRGDDGPLQIAAITPVVPRLPLGIVRTVLVGLLSFGASTWALRSCGDRWVTQCHYLAHGDGESAIELDNTHTCVLAASTPKRREDGLRALSDYLDEDPYRDEQTVARLDALARDTVGCVQLAASLLQAQRYDAALAESRGCGAIRIEHEALVALGHFEQAAALPVPAAEHEPALPALTTLVAAGRWREAAAAIRNTRSVEIFRNRDCLASWFEERGGDLRARQELDAPACAELREELDPASKRSSALLWLREPEAIIVRPESAYNALDLWFPIREEPGLTNRAIRLRQRAIKQVLDSDTDGAIVTAREVEELTRQILARGEDYGFSLRAPAVLLPSIQLYTPVIFDDIARRFSESERWWIERMKPDDSSLAVDSLRESYQKFVRLFARSREALTPERTEALDELSVAARQGKPERVMELVRSRRYPMWRAVDLLAVIPHVPSLRARLARELPYSRPGMFWSAGPAGHALDAFVHRELLEAVGATAAAASWDAIYRRYDAMLRDPSRALVLRLL